MRTDITSGDAPQSMWDRRLHARYRFSAPIVVHAKSGSAIRGMSLEISKSGLSALIGEGLAVGEQVELEPVVGSRVAAVVRRQTGRIYGFEFLNLTPRQIEQIVELCQILPAYQCKTLDI